MKVTYARTVMEKQLKDVLTRLTYLEEQQSLTQEEIPFLKKSFQILQTDLDECNKRRQDQFLVLQENNILLLQRILSFEDKIASSYERDFEQMRKSKEELNGIVSQAELKITEVAEKMDALVLSKIKKDGLNNKKYLECGKRIATLQRQQHKMNRRVSQFRRGQSEIMKKFEENSILPNTEMEMMRSNISLLQTEIYHFCENNNKLLNEFCDRIEKIPLTNFDNQAMQSDCAAMKDRGFTLKLSEYESDSESQDESTDDKIKVLEGDTVSKSPKQKEMYISQKGFLKRIANYQKDNEIKIGVISDKLNQWIQTVIDHKLKAVGNDLESKSRSSLLQVEQKVESFHSDWLSLENKLNLKFQENYDSQLKLLTINLNRKFQDFKQALREEPAQVTLTKQAVRSETHQLDQACSHDEADRKVEELTKTVMKIREEDIEKHVRRMCDEQRTLLKAELDKKFQVQLQKHKVGLSNLRGKMDIEMLEEDIERLARRVCNEERTLLKTEIDHKFEVHLQKYDVAVSKLERQVDMKVLEKDIEKHARKVCNEQRTLLQAWLDQKFQILLQKHDVTVSKLERKAVMEMLKEDIEKHARRMCNEQRTLMEAELDQIVQIRLQHNDVTAFKCETNEDVKMPEEDNEEDSRVEYETQRTLLRMELDQKFQIHLEKLNGIESELEEKVEKQFWATNRIQMDILKHEIANHLQVSKELVVKEMHSDVEKKIQECSNHFQTELGGILQESVESQKTDLLMILERRFDVRKDSLFSLGKMIKESNDAQMNTFRIEFQRKYDENVAMCVTGLLAKVDQKLEITNCNLEQHFQESNNVHSKRIQKELETKFEQRINTERENVEAAIDKKVLAANEYLLKTLHLEVQKKSQEIKDSLSTELKTELSQRCQKMKEFIQDNVKESSKEIFHKLTEMMNSKIHWKLDQIERMSK